MYSKRQKEQVDGCSHVEEDRDVCVAMIVDVEEAKDDENHSRNQVHEDGEP